MRPAGIGFATLVVAALGCGSGAIDDVFWSASEDTHDIDGDPRGGDPDVGAEEHNGSR
jgi:hypothetical protein